MKNLYVYSHIGNSRKNQEDNYFIGRGKYLSPADRDKMSEERKCKVDSRIAEQFCCCVSDGMGGHSSGEVASFLTAKYIDENYDEIVNENIKSEQYIKEFVKNLNEGVCSKSKSDSALIDMGATLCGVLSVEHKTYCFNVGDSRLYQYTNGILKQVTVDNTEGQRLLDLGLLTEEEVKTFPKRIRVSKYVFIMIDFFVP